MTGLRLNWRIENPTEIWTSSISEVGRSLQTPRLGETFVKPVDEFSDHTYQVVLKITEEKGMQNEILVIELAMDMKKEDEVAFSTSYILNRMDKFNWPEAEAYFREVLQQQPKDRWERFRCNKLLYQYGDFLGYALLSGDPKNKKKIHLPI